MRITKTQGSLIVVCLVVVGVGIFSTTQAREISELKLAVQNYSALNAELLQRVEENTNQRLVYEKEINRLKDNLLNSSTQLKNMALSVQQMREMISPDFEQLKEQARAEVAKEQQEQETTPANLVSNMMRNFSSPEMSNTVAKMQVDTQYAEFLRSLDMSSEKRDEVKQLLVDTLAERTRLLMQVRTGEIEQAELSGLSGKNAMSNALSAVLTDEELDQFDIYEGQQASRNIKRAYAMQLALYAPDVDTVTKDLVLDTLIEEINSLGDLEAPEAIGLNDASMSRYFDQQLQALQNARTKLLSQTQGEQRDQVDGLIDSLINQQELARTMSKGILDQPGN